MPVHLHGSSHACIHFHLVHLLVSHKTHPSCFVLGRIAPNDSMAQRKPFYGVRWPRRTSAPQFKQSARRRT
jgi:hypothetical protein